MTRFVRRAVAATGVIAFVLASPSATTRVDAAGHADCRASRFYAKCPAHVYRVKIRASATTTSEGRSAAGSYELVTRVLVRYAAVGRRDYYPPTVLLVTGPERPKLLSFRGSGTYTDAVCSVRSTLRAGPISWGVAGNASRIHRSKTPRIVYYSLSIGAGPAQDSPEPIPSPPPYDCPGEGGATTSFDKRLRTSDFHVEIGAHTSPIFSLNWDFHRPQAAGRMEFPLNHLTTGKRFELKLTGSNPYAIGTSKGTAHVIFEPVG